MIQFILKQQSYDEQDLHVSLATYHEELGAVVAAFKEFLRRAGYSPVAVDGITYVGDDKH